MKKTKGPKYLKFFNPLLQVLKDIGGEGKTSEVIDLVIEKMDISEEELDVVLKSGPSRVKNQIAWARNYLVKAGILDNASKRGVWCLTAKGLVANLSDDDSLNIFKEVQSSYSEDKSTEPKEVLVSDEIDESLNSDIELSEDILTILQNLPPAGFEKICQRLLRESGFKDVIVTGKPNDGGIDGEGLLEINPLMSFKVLFQAKRYKATVGPDAVRDFRGAMQGRADKGIIITTGRFTKEAQKEAVRVATLKVELVDGDALVELFHKFELGLIPKVGFDIDKEFFKSFKNM